MIEPEGTTSLAAHVPTILPSLIAPEIRTTHAADGYRCAVRVWPVAAARVRIVLLHGIISHGGWYAQSGTQLAAAGVEVHFLDRRGAGLNREALGDVASYATWARDVEGYVRALPSGPPTFLGGISWGGKLALAIARRRRVALAGVALICPGLFARQQPGGLRRLALAAACRLGLGRLRVPIPLQDPALFTDELSWQAFIRDDPLTLRKITLRAAREDLRLTAFARATPGKVQLPVLLQLAGRDAIIETKRVKEFCARLGSKDQTRREYAGASHTLEFDACAAEAIDHLGHWMLARC